MIMNKSDAEAILKKVFALSKAEGAEAGVNGGEGGNTRFALNGVTTSGQSSDLNLFVTSYYGKKSGSATTNQFDNESIEKCVRASEEIAKLAPEDPETMPILGPQQYSEVGGSYLKEMESADSRWRAQAVAQVLDPAKAKNLTAAGFIQTGANFQALGTSKGLFGYSTSTISSYTTTVRTADGTGSGWASAVSVNPMTLDTKFVADRSIWKAENSTKPVAIEPGKYTVILEPSAVADLIAFLMFSFDARSADEGRSFLSKEGGKTRLGDKLFSDKVHIYTDPQNEISPGAPFDGQGLPEKRMDFIKDGVVKNLTYSRFWAQKQGKEATPFPSNVIMDGGTKSVDELVAETDRGILVTRLWYIRMLNPQTLLMTGLTRDATFLVEKGKIKHPVKNFRFNQSPVSMLSGENIEAMGKPVRTFGSEVETFPAVVPPLRVRDFNFASLSDAV